MRNEEFRVAALRLYLGVPSTAHGDVPLQAPFFLELRSEVVRLRPLPVGDEGSNKNCRTVKICRRSKPITNFGNRWSLSPWRTNRRNLFTAPSAGESGRSLFPSVGQPNNQIKGTHLCANLIKVVRLGRGMSPLI